MLDDCGLGVISRAADWSARSYPRSQPFGMNVATGMHPCAEKPPHGGHAQPSPLSPTTPRWLSCLRRTAGAESSRGRFLPQCLDFEPAATRSPTGACRGPPYMDVPRNVLRDPSEDGPPWPHVPNSDISWFIHHKYDVMLILSVYR